MMSNRSLIPKKMLKTVLKQINLDNLVYNKRERKQTCTQVVLQSMSVIQNNKVKHKQKGRKKKNIELQTLSRKEVQQNQEPIQIKQLPSCEQLVLESNNFSEFNPKIKKSKIFHRNHKHIDLEDSSNEAQYKSKLILKRINKIFKKSLKIL